MRLVPAIDLRDGVCVRLFQGGFDEVTEYSEPATELAGRYADWGAKWIHIVDLDGARTGDRSNAKTIGEIARSVSACVQTGGGVRSRGAVESLLEAGASRVVIGSVAIEDPQKTQRWMQDFSPDRIVLAFDVNIDGDGEPRIATRGWQKDSGVSLWEALELFVPGGLKHVLCTDIRRDGALSGPNVGLYSRCAERYPGVEFQASGGIAGSGDLKALSRTGAAAAICGKALLEGRITRAEAEPFLQNA